MTRENLHSYATETTPANVWVPNTWPALAVWAVGKFGVGIVFLLMLVYVYQDMQAASRSMVEVVRANAVAIEAIAHRTEQTNIKVDRIEQDIKSARDREHWRPNQ